MNPFRLIAACLVVCSPYFWGAPAAAQQSGFYVVASKTRLGQVVTVAKSGGDFTSIQAAVNSITDASASKPYIVVVGPGTYSGRVVLKNYVSLEGSGEASTILTATSNPKFDDSYTLKTGYYSEVKSLTVKNIGGSEYFGVAIESCGVGDRFLQITAEASSAEFCLAIYLIHRPSGDSPTPTYLQDFKAIASGITYSEGMQVASTSPTLVNVFAKGTGASNINSGLIAFSSGHPYGYQCRFQGTTAAVDTENFGYATLANSMLDGGRSGTDFTCVQCYSGTYGLLGAQCQ